MILSENNILVPNKISLPYPFSMNRALPIDARSFFTSFEEAEEAVRYAVELERDENGYFILPPEIPEDTNENGGVDSEYYYGQTIVVTSENGQKADIYVVVKRYDLEGRVYGELQIPNSDFFSQYLSEEEIALLAQRMIGEYIHNNLNVDCINDYIFTNELDSCGNEIPSNGLYAYGLKEVDGKIELCDYAKKVLAFDPDTPYDKDTNPIATLDSIRGRLAEVWKELNKKVDKIPGYGLSQNDFTDCLLDKLMSLPTIQLEGDNKLIINGRAFRLTEWYDIFDYYVGWTNLKKRSTFTQLTKDELLNAVTDTGIVPSIGKLYGPDVACGRNTFFLMRRKNLNIDGNFRGEYSELHSNGVVSPIRTWTTSLIPHRDVMINDIPYEVFGLHTSYPNSSDTIQIAFNVTLYDYYVGWMNIDKKSDFYTLIKDELVSHAEFRTIEGMYDVYDGTFGNYNLFYVMVKDGVYFDEPVDDMVSQFISGTPDSLVSPINRNIGSVMMHDTISLNDTTYSVYGIFSYYPNSEDSVHIIFSK